jgi:acetyl esterase/lipase
MDPERFAVAGDSVGGNMAAAVTLLSRERGGPDIALQLLFYPVTDAAFDTASYHQFAEGYHLRRDAWSDRPCHGLAERGILDSARLNELRRIMTNQR